MKALSLMTLGLFGLALPFAPQDPAPTATHVLIYHETPAEFARRSGSDSEAYWKEWGSYIGKMNATGKVVGGSAFEPAESGETLESRPNVAKFGVRVSGYLAVKVDSLAEAKAFAEASPAIRNGGAVEVRPLVKMMNMGGAR
jgi:hypothetical protein